MCFLYNYKKNLPGLKKIRGGGWEWWENSKVLEIQNIYCFGYRCFHTGMNHQALKPNKRCDKYFCALLFYEYMDNYHILVKWKTAVHPTHLGQTYLFLNNFCGFLPIKNPDNFPRLQWHLSAMLITVTQQSVCNNLVIQVPKMKISVASTTQRWQYKLVT